MCYLYVYIHMYVWQNVCNHQNHQNHCKCKMQMSVILSCKRACFLCVPRNLQSDAKGHSLSRVVVSATPTQQCRA
jgi:hypothetical protein